MAKSKNTKYLVETSAVRPAVGSSTSSHNEHFAQQTKGGSLWTSTYIRMEFIRRWVCDMIRMALTVEQCDDVADALIRLEQDFSPRSVKSMLACIAHLLRETGTISNTHMASEEIASQAVRWLKQFDHVFVARVTNLCKCQIGGKVPRVDYNHLLQDLHAFYEEFMTPVEDCEVNAFLALGSQASRTASVLRDPAAQRLRVGIHLAELATNETWITCRECSSIGDGIIALEQPRSWCLVHVDGSFNDLCRVLGKPHTQIKSVTSIEKNRSEAET